jgi:hypothetical protein
MNSMGIENTTDEFIVNQLQKKISTYEMTAETFPGFGWLPPTAVAVFDDNIYTSRLVADYQGAFVAFAIAATIVALNDTGKPELLELANRYQKYFDRIASFIVTAFYGNDEIRSFIEFHGRDVNATRTNLFIGFDCNKQLCTVDNPFLPEILAVLAYLYGNWTDYGGEQSRRSMWNNREHLKPIDYEKDTVIITVERGLYYSADEKLKYLFLPYLDSSINERVFLNGERARTHYSATNRIRGLFSASMPCKQLPDTPTICVDEFGIEVCKERHFNQVNFGNLQELAFMKYSTDTITPYAAFPLLLHNTTRGYGLAWYLTMLQASKMIGPYGMSEASDMDGIFN